MPPPSSACGTCLMSDDNDLHEPEHDHLLDPEFYDEYVTAEVEAQPMFDDAHEEDDASGMLDDDDE
ncbi:hypothetical protein G3435_15680 [Pseudomonas sp. MAFF212428]|uniref:Uncharacterized protein n=1 Tax=Pseudomonas brassicae TaxID=2708063 RepID=A0A6B3NXE4_9PSED|nr:hypothetical protein [Pseudomonas brassicae]NER61019.1 hypothetical protein [Pseudomonas brassicae]NER64134.1 hypothetical protein [Pseudomonas brassicae]